MVNKILCMQLTGSYSMELLDQFLVDLVNTARPGDELYGGDLQVLVTVMSDVVGSTTTRLLPTLNRSVAQSLSANITSVGLL